MKPTTLRFLVVILLSPLSPRSALNLWFVATQYLHLDNLSLFIVYYANFAYITLVSLFCRFFLFHCFVSVIILLNSLPSKSSLNRTKVFFGNGVNLSILSQAHFSGENPSKVPERAYYYNSNCRVTELAKQNECVFGRNKKYDPFRRIMHMPFTK
jgi:hypothetical protein